MDLEYLIEKAVKQAVSESVKHITINQMVVNDRWVTKKDALHILGCSKNTLVKHINLGIVPKPNSTGKLVMLKKLNEMANNTIDTFTAWADIVDYESGETSVTLINAKGEKVAEYGYSRFTKDDFERFRSTCLNVKVYE